MGNIVGQEMIRKGLILLCLPFLSMLHAEDIDSILQEYNQKNALSQKTIDENKGHLILFTREKIEEMHAKTLKDVFKTAPVIYYHENRFALPDPLTSGAFEPYRSNYIRLYVDGVEITQGWMGSGLMLYGDLNIDFVDHIEFYYMTPSFETTVEPAYLTIFLYSKDPKRDMGGKLDLVYGSRGYNSQSISYGEHKEDLSYMINFSHTDARREKVDNGSSTPLSRDFERTQLFSYLKTEDQIFHLQVMKKNTDSLAGMSWDATPLVSTINYLNLHMDYGIDLNEFWRAQLTYDWLRTDMNQADNIPLNWGDVDPLDPFYDPRIFNGEYKNSTYTAELTYKETIGDHRITAGMKGRYKKLDSFERNGQDALVTPFTSESIGSLFFQDQYALSPQELLTFGISYNHISRNGGIEDDSLLLLRLGYIYTSEHWSYKAYLYRNQFALEPLVRYLNFSVYENTEPQTTFGVTQEIAYTDEKQRIRFLLHTMKDEESLFQDRENGLGKETKYFTTIFNYDYNFNVNNKVNLQLYYAHYRDIFNLNKLEDVSGYLSFTNSYENFDFYNGVVWHSNSLNWENYFDLTSSVSWNINEDLTVILKGDNLLNKAKKTSQITVNPMAMPPEVGALEISPIDQRITIELEYMF